MAKAKKTIKAAPLKNRNDDLTDDTFRNPVQGLIRFNSACVVFMNVDTEQKTVSIELTDEVNGKKLTGTCNLEEAE